MSFQQFKVAKPATHFDWSVNFVDEVASWHRGAFVLVELQVFAKFAIVDFVW
jgi:hypothetical protein